MATFEQPSGFPNILLVTGSDVSGGNYQIKLRSFLYGANASTSPVREGTHDFWITYHIPTLRASNWSLEDLSKTPRKMRGIVEMGAVPGDLNEDTMRNHLTVLLQEVGHHWLVPPDLKFNVQNTLLSMPSETAMTQAINDEARFSGPPLAARGNIHWSAYWQADSSPLDGLYYVKQGQEDGHAIWETQDFPGPTLSPTGLTPVQMSSSFNDLDRIVIGTKTSSMAYTATGGAFRRLDPRLSAPHPYHAGLFVAFEQTDFIYFGFYQDHRTLGVQRTGGKLVTAALGTGYHPLADRFNAVALRIVRRGNTYYFQARYDNPMIPPEKPAPKLDDDLDKISPVRSNPAFEWKKFQTMAKLSVSLVPQAVGVIVKKWDHPFLAELAFLDLSIFEGVNSQVLRTNAVPVPFAPGRAYRLLPNGLLRSQVPVPGPILRTRNGRLHIIAPFSTVNRDGSFTHHPEFDHTASVDRAPKVLTKAPTGEFAVATSAKIWRTIFTPWAGGYARGRTVWGIERSLAASTTVVPDNIVTEKQPPPPKNTYRIAFIIVAANRSNITDAMIERADAIRRYWDEAFEKATEDQRHSDSRLDIGRLRLSPSSINFGTEVVGNISNPETVRVINDGTGDLTVCFPGSLTGAFFWDEFVDVIPPGGESSFQVEFAPTTQGPAHRRLSVQSDALESPHVIDLRGTGTIEVEPP